MDTEKAVPHKEGIVLLVYSELKKKHYMIVKLASSCKAQLIRIDPCSGALKWDEAVGRDTFESEAAALAYLQAQGKVEVVSHAKSVLGYVVLGPVGLLLLAEGVRVAAVLPGGHEIKTVTQSRWHRISLQQPDLDPATQAATKQELDKGIEKLTSFPIDGAHFFCDTLDITRSFPSEKPVSQPSWHFVWNRWLSLSFRSAGLDGPNAVCPALLQGMAESRDLEDFDGKRFSYCLISRRCRLHVGPRYKARGLNENADPGNEIECDQVVWKQPASPDKPLLWSRYMWRRGSVPLWWTVTIRNGGMGEAEIRIRNVNTFKGSRRYVRRLQKRCMPNPHLDPDPPHCDQAKDPAMQVPVVFFSLLRKGTPDRDRSEAKLAEAFDFMASQVRVQHRLPVTYIALDWHQLDKELGSDKLVEAFWTQLSAVIPRQGFALGSMSKVGPDHTDANGVELSSAALFSQGASPRSMDRCCSAAGKGWEVRWYRQQRGVTRYNCADSLDRTNVGSFFGAVQVFVEQCRELDIAIAATSAGAASVARQAHVRRQAAAAAAAALAAAAAPPATSAALKPPPSGTAGSLGNQGDKRTSGSSSGFLSSLGKEVSRGLNTMMGDLRLSPKGSPRDLKDLRANSAPNMARLGGSAGGAQGGSSGVIGGLGAGTASGAGAGVGAAAGGTSSLDEVSRQLPPGWEAKYDSVNKRVFFVDHNTKTTTWERPPLPTTSAAVAAAAVTYPVSPNTSETLGGDEDVVAGLASGSGNFGGLLDGRGGPATPPRSPVPGSKRIIADGSGSDTEQGLADKERFEPLTPWCMLTSAKVSDFARRINPGAMSAIAELFLMNGDMCAWLYTGSPAMHSEKITLFEPENSRLKKAGAGTYSNGFIAIRRRYNNVMMDDERKFQVETFLGVKSRSYFPTLHLFYRDDAKIEGDYPESDDEDDPMGLIGWPIAEKSRDKERNSVSNIGDMSDMIVERYGSHTRSFSSEKILQDFQTLQRLGASMAGSAAAGLGGRQGGGSPHDKKGSSNPKLGALELGSTSPAVALSTGSFPNLVDFDGEVQAGGIPPGQAGSHEGSPGKASSSAAALRPFADPLGLL